MYKEKNLSDLKEFGLHTTLAQDRNATGTQPERNWNATGTQPERNWNATGTQPERNWYATGTQPERNWNATGTQPERNRNTTGTQREHNWNTSGTQLEHKWNTTGTQIEKWNTSLHFSNLLPGASPVLRSPSIISYMSTWNKNISKKQSPKSRNLIGSNLKWVHLTRVWTSSNKQASTSQPIQTHLPQWCRWLKLYQLGE